MKTFKLLTLIFITLAVISLMTPFAEFILANPGTMAVVLFLAAVLLAFTSFTAGLFLTHLKFARISSKN